MKKIILLLTLFLAGLASMAQDIVIHGRITDDKGTGIANASVVVKGTNIGTTTNSTGNFSISVPSFAKALVASYVGMGEKEIILTSGKNNYTAKLSSTVADLQEVIVVGYGTQKKADLTGSVATIKSGDIENRPFTSVDKALQGQVAGLQSVASSGAPGSIQSIRIRGISSINASNAPLWVVDGVAINSGDASRISTSANLLSSLNANDIESISVLKDAAAASIYGSRAANGVIMVTTKSGRSGATKFRFDVEAGQNDRAYENEKYRPLNAAEYFAITREGLLNANIGVTTANVDAVMTSNFGYGNGNDFNWLNAVTQTGTQKQYNLSASGGNEKTTFYASGGYFKQIGTVINSKYEKYNGALRLTNKASNRLTFNLNVSGGAVKQSTPNNGGAFANPVLLSYFLLPSRLPYKADGTFNINTTDFPAATTFNPIALASMNKDQLRQTSMRANFSGEYRLLDNLRFKTTLGMDYNVLEEDVYWNPFYGDGFSTDASSAGRSYSYYTRYFNYVWTNLLNYHQKINRGGDVYIDLAAGYESQKSSGFNSSLQAQGMPTSLDLIYAASGAKPQTASATLAEYAFISQFSSANLNFKNRYILSGTFRRDGSSRFGSNKRYGNFWSVGGSWNVDNEAFMANMDFFSQLKLRASYGVNGNAGIGNYDWIPGYSYGSPYNNAPGSSPTNIGNENLTWELNKPLNVGIDLGILKNRVSLTVEYYKRKSEDLLLDLQLSRTTGFTNVSKNIGAMENKGVEVTLNAIPVQTKDFSWTVNLNYAYNKNRITSLPDNADITSGLFVRRVGQDFQSFNLREYAGVDPANGDPLWYVDGTKSATTNNITAAQRQINGSASPKYFGGLTNTFSYKGFTLDVLMYYNFGNLIADTWSGYLVGSGNAGTWNKVARQLERWQKPGDITTIPKYVYNGNKNFHDNSNSFFLNKGDFIRLRNVQVGYDLSKTLLSKVHLSSVNFYVRGTNLWTWVRDKNLGFDPEEGTTSSTNLDVFIPRSMTVGLNIGF